jgi:hypothetical protein
MGSDELLGARRSVGAQKGYEEQGPHAHRHAPLPLPLLETKRPGSCTHALPVLLPPPVVSRPRLSR